MRTKSLVFLLALASGSFFGLGRVAAQTSSNGEQVLPYAASLTLNPSYAAASVTLTGNLSSISLPSGTFGGESFLLSLCQGSGGPYTTPATWTNVTGATTVASTGCTRFRLAWDDPAAVWVSAVQGSTGVTNANLVFLGDSRTCGVNATSNPACTSEPYTIGTTGYAAITTGTAASGSTALTVASGTGILVGQRVAGQGIGPSTTVSAVTGTAVTLSLATTSALTAAAVSFGNTDYPSQAMTLAPLAGHGTGYNLGIGGQTCSQIALRYAADAHPLSPAVTGKSGYLFVECGTNAEGSFTPTCTGTSGGSAVVCSSVTGIDVGETVTGTGIGAGATVAASWTGSTTIPLTVANSAAVSGTVTFASTPASIVSNIARVWALGRADGYKVIASTTPYHYGSSAQRQENDAYNLLILAARSSYDDVMDVHAKLTDYTDTSLWSADGIHFTNSGYGVIAQQAANALQATGGDLFGPTPGYFRTYGTGTQNTRLSISALYSQTTGSNDIAAGEFAGGVCTTCTNSLFIGPSAGGQAISGDGGFFLGPLTGQNITAVSQQVMIGKQAGGAATNASINSVGVGAFALASDAGGNNTGIGTAACDLVASGSYDSCLGSNAEVGASNTGAVQLGGGTNSTSNSLQFQGLPLAGTTKFTATGCSNATTLGQSLTGSFHSGTAGTCTVVVTPGITAPNGFFCRANDLTTLSDLIAQTATTTTTFTLSGTTASGDVINFGCSVY